jgi:hypothetical protein
MDEDNLLSALRLVLTGGDKREVVDLLLPDHSDFVAEHRVELNYNPYNHIHSLNLVPVFEDERELLEGVDLRLLPPRGAFYMTDPVTFLTVWPLGSFGQGELHKHQWEELRRVAAWHPALYHVTPRGFQKCVFTMYLVQKRLARWICKPVLGLVLEQCFQYYRRCESLGLCMN